jgi:serine/threonine-protein kinase
MLLARGRSAEAEQVFARAMELAPADDVLCRQIARTYGTKRAAESEKLLLRAIGLNPRYWENYNAAGGFYVERGRLDEAQTMFERIISLRPDSPLGYNNLAMMQLLRGRFAEAEPLLEMVNKLRPSVISHNNLGSVYYAMGRFADAEREFRSAIEAGMSVLEPHVGLGDALRQLGRPGEAATAYARAIDLARTRLGVNPTDAVTRAGLAMLYGASGRCAESAKETRKLQVGASPPLASYYASIGYALCGNLEGAERAALHAIEGGLVWDVGSNPDLRGIRQRPAVKERLARATAG